MYQLLMQTYQKDFPQTSIKRHDKIPCYSTGGPSNYPIDKLAGKIEYYCSLGFKGVKIGAGAYFKDKGSEISNEPNVAADFEAEKLRFLRERFGNDLYIMLDAHMGNHSKITWGLNTALAVARMAMPLAS